MSFMFKPLDYDDTTAVNHPLLDDALCEDLTFGTVAAGARIAADLAGRAAEGRVVAAFDGYASARFDDLCGAIAQALRQRGVKVAWHSMSELYKPVEELDAMVSESLPLDYEEDPVLLFGRLYEGSLDDFLDAGRCEALRQLIAEAGRGEVILLSGIGSTAEALADLADVTVYLDVTPKNAAVRAREGKLVNIGDREPRPFKELMRRNYYVDFEVIVRNRLRLLRGGLIDYYVSANQPDDFVLMRGATAQDMLDSLARQPFRTKPVYLEGIWGGEYMRKARNLPSGPKNVAWIFDLIPMEVSVLIDAGGRLVEFPFSTFVQSCAESIVGEESVRAFGTYFPIRFNYDDTYHSNGNMSVQCHPDRELCRSMYGEPGSQDEAYYVVATAHRAKTFIGFNKGVDPSEFLAAARESERTGADVDYERYVNHVDSVPGRQVMIPGGTIHASGRGQLILELGSLTMGSYTYKLYDYNRVDADGERRPIHLNMGERALKTERDTDWVRENVAIDPIPDGSGEGWEQFVIGKTDLMYYMTKNLFMDAGAKAEFSNDGRFTVLTLVDGENVRVYSKSHPEFCYDQKYLDIVVVPASIDDYVIENTGYQPCVVHKTMLREGFQSVVCPSSEER